MGLSFLCQYVAVIEVCLCSQPQQPSGDQGKSARALYDYQAGMYKILLTIPQVIASGCFFFFSGVTIFQIISVSIHSARVCYKIICIFTVLIKLWSCHTFVICFKGYQLLI